VRRIDIREAMMAQADLAPESSTEGKARYNEYINRALQVFSGDHPYLFNEDILPMSVTPDIAPANSTDTLRATGDAWVLETELISTETAVPLATDNVYDGWTLLCRDPEPNNGTRWLWYTVRSISLVAGKLHIVVDRPWRNSTDTGIEWRLVRDWYNLPREVLKVKSITVSRNQLDYPLTPSSQDRAEFASITGSNELLTVGTPRWVFRRPHQSLRGSNFRPLVELNPGDLSWIGPEPQGEFEYLFTLCIGRQEFEIGRLQNPATQNIATGTPDRRRPYLESPASPASETISNTGTTNAIDVTTPDMDFMIGFSDAATLRYHKSGVRKRIYRRRISRDPNPIAPAPLIESRDGFFLMVEQDGFDEVWTDNGSITPDWSVPYVNVPGVQAVGLWPRPDAEYLMQVRCNIRPTPLFDDYDSVELPPLASDALVFLALTYLYEAAGDRGSKQQAQYDYDQKSKELAGTFGDFVPENTVIQRRVHSARRSYTGRRQWPSV
jgi:hypothetical protein